MPTTGLKCAIHNDFFAVWDKPGEATASTLPWVTADMRTSHIGNIISVVMAIDIGIIDSGGD